MKLRLFTLTLLLGIGALAQPLAVQFSTLGPWTLCPAFPKYCVPDDQKTYVVLVKASSPDIVAFRYRIEYVTNGVTHVATGVFARADSDLGSSNSGPLTLGQIDSLTSVTADELVPR